MTWAERAAGRHASASAPVNASTPRPDGHGEGCTRRKRPHLEVEASPGNETRFRRPPPISSLFTRRVLHHRGGSCPWSKSALHFIRSMPPPTLYRSMKSPPHWRQTRSWQARKRSALSFAGAKAGLGVQSGTGLRPPHSLPCTSYIQVRMWVCWRSGIHHRHGARKIPRGAARERHDRRRPR